MFAKFSLVVIEHSPLCGSVDRAAYQSSMLLNVDVYKYNSLLHQ